MGTDGPHVPQGARGGPGARGTPSEGSLGAWGELYGSFLTSPIPPRHPGACGLCLVCGGRLRGEGHAGVSQYIPGSPLRLRVVVLAGDGWLDGLLRGLRPADLLPLRLHRSVCPVPPHPTSQYLFALQGHMWGEGAAQGVQELLSGSSQIKRNPFMSGPCALVGEAGSCQEGLCRLRTP